MSKRTRKCYITKIENQETPGRPVVLTFENGILQPGQEKSLTHQMYRDKDKFVLATATSNMVYRGPVEQDEMFTNYLAIRNKRTNEMRLVAVDYAVLSPYIKDAQDQNSPVEIKNSSMAELNKQFGSKRAKRQTEQRERMQLDIENVREQLEQTVADIQVDVRDMVPLPVEESSQNYRPPINRNGATVEEVYSLEEIVSVGVLNSMADEVERVLGCVDYDELGTTSFVTEEIKKLRTSSTKKRKQLCQLLLYIDCLIKFLVSQAKTVSNKSYKSCSYSELVHNEILQKFTIVTGHGRLRPNVMRDKCLCYILVLGMIVCNNTLYLDRLSVELKIGIKKLQDVCRILAFTVSKNVATLKLPLPAPVTTTGSGKKRK